jgi:hypothetical protein
VSDECCRCHLRSTASSVLHGKVMRWPTGWLTNLELAVCCTRRDADIALSVSTLAAYCSAPSSMHLSAVQDAIRYVGCAERGITFGLTIASVEVRCNASLDTCKGTKRSTTG